MLGDDRNGHLSHGEHLINLSRWGTPHVIMLALSAKALVTPSKQVLR
jgi:hypothetical protein